MSLPRYPKYKDSGVKWLDEVPEHWDTRRIRFLFQIKKRIAGTEGYDVLSITQQGIKVKDIESNDGQLAMDYSKYQFVEIGDFAMNHMDLLTGYVDISGSFGVTSPDYRVFSMKDSHANNHRYFLHIFQNAYRQKIFYAFGQGASHLGRWRLPTDQFQDFVLPLPSLPEQSAIATFLDREIEKIDALTGKQQRLIELLKEKRQAIISLAVTKGLNFNAPMKDSGIKWLGEIPAHWAVGRIKRLALIISKGTTPTTIGAEFSASGVRFIKAENITESGVSSDPEFFIDERVHQLLRRSSLAENDVLVVIAGATTGKSAVMGPELLPANTNQAVSFIRLHDPTQSQFVNHWLSTDHIQKAVLSGSVQSAQPNLSMGELGNLPIALPPPDEVKQITEHLEAYLGQSLQLLSRAEESVLLLQERRAALISAAVTGKIDVRNYSSQEASAVCQ